MGAPRGEFQAAKFADRQVQVTLTRAFLMRETEVTVGEWLDTGFAMPNRMTRTDEGDCLERECPIAKVSFYDAVSFANRYSERRGFDRCYELSECTGEVGHDLVCRVMVRAEKIYECAGYRLPTEAEWEYAGRAGVTTAYYSGDVEAVDLSKVGCTGSQPLERIAWYCHNSGGRSHRVGEKTPNGWGLHDMLGNVFEWCNDLYDANGYGTGPLVDPTGTLTPGRDLTPAESNPAPGRVSLKTLFRIARGGMYNVPFYLAKVDKRLSGESGDASTHYGFRVVRTVTDR